MQKRDRPTRYAIGPFSIDNEAGTVTLAPGVYVIHEPIVFGITKETKIENVEYKRLLDSDSRPAISMSAIAHDDHTA
jgi:hypothetical protein